MQRIFAFLIAAAASAGIAFANPATNAPLAGEKFAQKEAPKDAKKPEAKPAPVKDAKPATPAKDAKPAPMKDAKKEPMDINTASEKDLATLAGIGEVRAKAIVKGRPYKGKDDLVNKKIIPEKAYNDIKDQIVAKQATAEKKTAEKKK